MKKISLFLSLLIVFGLAACKTDKNKDADSVTLDSSAQKAGYALGVSIAKNLQRDSIPIVKEEMLQAMKDVAAGNDLKISKNQVMPVIQRYFTPEGKKSVSKDSLSYAIGVSIGENFKTAGLSKIDLNSFSKALDDVRAGSDLSIQPEKADSVIRAYQKDVLATAGIEFLKKKEQEEGVKKTDSGLLYKVLQEGTGKQPKATDIVTVHYTGKLIDGTVFDSSVERGKPATFPLNGVIPGWTEGVQLMKEGAKYRFYIPYELAYGETGAPPKIPPFSALVFDVELIKVQPAPKKAPAKKQ